MDRMKLLLCGLYVIMFLRDSFLPSLPRGCRHAHLRIKSIIIAGTRGWVSLATCAVGTGCAGGAARG